MNLLEHALELVQREAFPQYKRSDSREPPFSRKEFTPCAIAIVLINSGLDYHLARLKWFRDVVVEDPPLPHTPYFNWTMGCSLSCKIERLLIKRTERRLKKQLLELTVVRDAVAHPKLYLIRQLMRADYSFSKQTATLASGEKHRDKTIQNKLKHSERTKTLRLPLVQTWITYPDIVACILVLNRFIYFLEHTYGNPYAYIGDFYIRKGPAGFFDDRESGTTGAVSLTAWARAFFNALSDTDKQQVQRRLGADASTYIDRPPLPSRKPQFLRKAPPWATKP